MRIDLARGDITELAADAIVNAANEELTLGSGVAGAIRSKGGPAVAEACAGLAPIEAGEAVATPAGKLPYRCIIHAVAPRVCLPDWEARLARAIVSVVRVAEEQGVAHVGVPALGTGVFGLPLARSARIMISAALEVSSTRTLERLTFCLYDDEAYQAFERALSQARSRPRPGEPHRGQGESAVNGGGTGEAAD